MMMQRRALATVQVRCVTTMMSMRTATVPPMMGIQTAQRARVRCGATGMAMVGVTAQASTEIYEVEIHGALIVLLKGKATTENSPPSQLDGHPISRYRVPPPPRNRSADGSADVWALDRYAGWENKCPLWGVRNLLSTQKPPPQGKTGSASVGQECRSRSSPYH